MKMKKTFVLLIAGLVLLSGCNGGKKVQKNLLKEMKGICRENLDTTDYYNLGKDSFSIDKEVKDLLRTYLLVRPKDKVVSDLSVVLNSSPENFKDNIAGFKKEYKKSVFLEYVEYLEEIGIDGVKSVPELIPAFEKKYPGSVFTEHMYLEDLRVFFSPEIYSKNDFLLRSAVSYNPEKAKSSLEEYSKVYLALYLMLSNYDNSDYDFEAYLESDEYKELETSYVNIIKELYDTEKVSLYINKYPDSKASAFLKQSQTYIKILKDYYSTNEEDLNARTETLNKINDYLEKYSRTPLGFENLKDGKENLLKEIDKTKEKQADKIWYITNYVDSNGKETDNEYLSNEFISGTCKSRKRTDNNTKMRFLIDSRNEMTIMLYEQDKTVSGKKDEYSITVTNSIGAVYKLSGTNFDDRISLNDEDSLVMNNLLNGGDKIKLQIKCIPTDTEYSYDLDTTGYNRVLTRLK